MNIKNIVLLGFIMTGAICHGACQCQILSNVLYTKPDATEVSCTTDSDCANKCPKYQHRCNTKDLGKTNIYGQYVRSKGQLTDANLPENAPTTNGVCGTYKKCACPAGMRISSCTDLDTGGKYKSILV
jgi:hypothetical protein